MIIKSNGLIVINIRCAKKCVNRNQELRKIAGEFYVKSVAAEQSFKYEERQLTKFFDRRSDADHDDHRLFR